MIDLVLINPDVAGAGMNEATKLPPLGLAYIAAAAEKAGYCCLIIDAYLDGLNAEAVCARIPAATGCIGVSVNATQYESAVRLFRMLRERFPDTTLFAGGPSVAADPQRVLTDVMADGVICGEGEEAVCALLANRAAGRVMFDPSISGAVYRTAQGEVVSNPVQRIADLDALPFPAYHLLAPFSRYKRYARSSPAASMVTSRGCAHECTFCSKDIFARRVTFHSAENVLAQIDHLVSAYGVRQIDILDDNFMAQRERAEQIFEGLIARNHRLAVNLQSGVRSEFLDEKMLGLMKRAGVFKIAFGIESADEAVLTLCRKRLDLDRVRAAAVAAKRFGMVTVGFFVIGLPGETDEGFAKTLDFARDIRLDIANFCVAVPFPGTELYRMVEAKGCFLIDTRRQISDGFYNGSVFFEYPGVSADDVARRYREAYRRFYSWQKRLSIVMTLRTFDEFRWLWDVGCMILRGLLRRHA